MNFLSLLAVAGLLAVPSPCRAEWTSPHPLEQEEKAPVALLPFPSHVEWKQGRCSGSLPGHTDIYPDQKDKYGEEGYELDIRPDGVRLGAATPAGVFYATCTLKQLRARDGSYPCCFIRDRPAFPLRGFLYDCGRNFKSIDSLKELLDGMARVKMNIFQWHLTDHPAWRIECKKYPVLNDPAKRRPGRDVEATYSYDDIRELFQYARDRQITIIPELDMPGHSEFFPRCFGFTMHSPQGMEVLEELLEEFCREIPQEICPYLHIGADEVRIPNAAEFVKRMSAKVRSLGRTPLQWGGQHDLPVLGDNIAQIWADENTTSHAFPAAAQKSPYVDSSSGYINALDPSLLIRRLFFRQLCGIPSSDGKGLGGIVCLWPDVRVADKSRIPFQSPQWPAIFAAAERYWKGLPEDGSAFCRELPPGETESRRAFESFERRMEKLSGSLPFPYWRDSFITWTVTGPVPSGRDETARVRQALLTGQKRPDLPSRKVDGGNLYLKSRAGQEGIFSSAKPGHTAWTSASFYSPRGGTMYAMVGFDAPGRATHRGSGMPHPGEWSQCGTRIWMNGREIKDTRTFKLAGQRRYENHTWSPPASELPFENEEFWWLREPVAFTLKPGWNTLLIEQPYTGDFQSWGVSFLPVKKEGNRWVADESFSPPSLPKKSGKQTKN